MRLTKQKRHRKIVRFYTACYGFREPFKVLCDGTFIHHLSHHNLTPPDSTVSNALASPVQLFTTTCAVAELESLGRSYAASLNSAHRDFRVARCSHDEKVSAWDCIIETIGDNNPEHFFVASQDSGLRKQCQQIPGVPVMYGLRNAVYLDQLTPFQREYVKASEEERLRMTESEYKLLQNRLKKLKEVGSSTGEDEEGDEMPAPRVLDNRKSSSRRGLDVKDKVQFKRKRAKAPNPLSCKKKKNTSSSAPKSKNNNAGSEAPKSRSRKRKRTRTTKSTSGTATATN